MNRKLKIKQTIRIILIIISIYITISAIWGGVNLIVDPTGKGIKLDAHLPKVTFVNDYMLLGIVLISAIGLLHLLSCILLINHHNKSALIVGIVSITLLIWTTLQLVFIGWFFYSTLYLILSLIELILGIVYYSMRNVN